MKRIITLLITAVLLLSACGADPTPADTSAPDVTQAPESTVLPEVTEVPAETEVPETEPKTEVERVDYKIIVKDDTYVYNSDGTVDFSDKNFGKENDIQLKSNKHSLTRYAYLKFDISSLAGDEDFTAIELDLMLKTKQSMPGNPENAVVAVYSLPTDGWDETTVTFNNRPEYVDIVTQRDDVKNPGTVFSFSVTSYVRKALEHGETEVAFYLADLTGVPLHIKFESKDGGKQAPALSVYYGTKVDTTSYTGKMWGADEPELSENGIDNIVGLRKSELYRLHVVEDTYVEAGISADKNFGSSEIFDVKAISAGKEPDQYYREALLKFDITSVADLEYTNVYLELDCKLVEKGDIPVELKVYGCYPYDWDEKTVTFNTLPEKEDLVASVDVKVAGPVRIDVTDYVKKYSGFGDEHISFILTGDENSVRRLQFNTRESNRGIAGLVFNDESTGKGFTTYLPYSGVNPWDNAMEMVSAWLIRWEEIKKGGDGTMKPVERIDSEYALSVDAAMHNETDGADTKYTAYPTRTVDTLKGYNASTDVGKCDIYGGLMDESLRQEATGFFYTKKIGDRWWTIDPLGYPFFRTAVVTISMGNATQSAKELARYGSAANWAEATTDRLQELGFNSAGGWSKISDLIKVDQPLSQTYVMYVLKRYCDSLGLDVTTGGNTALMNDVMPVFDPGFPAAAQSDIKSIVTPYASSPYVYGWMSDNELPASINMLDKTLASDVTDGRFNYSYAVAWTFMMLKTGKADVSEKDVTDELRREYRAMVYDRYFEVITDALERYAPYHQYMGCRYLSGCYGDEYAMRVAGYYCDVITFNYYNAWEADPELIANQVNWAGKPIVITEWYAKGMDIWEQNNQMTNKSGWGWTVKTQNDRGPFYENFALQLIESGCCVGFDWFLYRDNVPNDLTADLSNRDSNKGIVDNDGVEYTELTKHMSKVNNQKYSLIKFFDAR